MSAVSPLQREHLDEVGQFLHHNLAKRISPQAWVSSLTHRWAQSQPNFGMQLRAEDGRLVGVLLAVYSDQQIDGKVEQFCNPHSWCVLDEFRHASINLVISVIKQRGYHFTMFTPNPKVAQVFLGLRFRLLDDRLLYLANRPSLSSWLWPQMGGSFVDTDAEQIVTRLSGAALAEFQAHRYLPWLRFVAFGVPGDACLVIYKPGRWKKLPCALIGHVSDPAAMQRHGHLLRHHLLVRRGLALCRVEARFLSSVPMLAYRSRRTQPKLVVSKTLNDSQIRDIYSELMALDI